MRFQPSYGANETFVLTTKLPVDVSIPSAARIGARVGFTSVMEKAGKGAQGRTATIGFVERDGKAVYAINITGDRPMLVTPDMAEWAALTTDESLIKYARTGNSKWDTLMFSHISHAPPELVSYVAKPKVETKTVSADKVEQQAPTSPWYMHPTVLVGGTLAAVALYLHMTKGKE